MLALGSEGGPSPDRADALVWATMATDLAFTVGIRHRIVGPLHAGLLLWTLYMAKLAFLPLDLIRARPRRDAALLREEGYEVVGEAPDGETALSLIELYRHSGEWKLRVLGAGYSDGLRGVARDFGVNL